MQIYQLTAKSAVTMEEVLLLITPIEDIAKAVKLIIEKDGDEVCTITSFKQAEKNGNG
jgi:hypothetical protein